MKKYLFFALMFSFVLLWCKKTDLTTLQVATIADLTALQNVITQVSQEMQAKTISLEQAQILLDQLQQKYVDLTISPKNAFEEQFASLQKIFDNKSIGSYTLPLWSKRLGMTYPQRMILDKSLSKSIITDKQISYILVYSGEYTVALQQAKLIAQKAKLQVSKNFVQAQALAKVGNIDYISGLDISGLTQWIVYLNHELLDTNIDNFLSVSVDPTWTLVIEVTKYN